ncbi:hypothetical protein AHF37_06816 [Paragonimus kellicotti]|nr:hypothetical protein AHF37_06816 [Paragonimus kellicotti]
MTYLRTPAGKNVISSVTPKKSSKRNSGQRGRSGHEKQRNVSATNKIPTALTSTFSEPSEPTTLIPVSQIEDDIAVDPDVAMTYLRTPAGKNVISSVTPKKSSKRNSGQRGRSGHEKQRNVSATNKIPTALTSTFSEPSEPTTLIPVSQIEDDIAANSQLSLLDHIHMHSLASLISEPLQLAEALGLPEEELNRVRMMMMTGKDLDRSSNQLVYEIIRTWKQCYLMHQLPLRCGSARDGDNTTSEADNAVREPLNDLVDVFHSLGYFEAAELVSRIMNAGLP